MFNLNSVSLTKKQLITDPELLRILRKDIKEGDDTLAYTLITLNAFMLQVLNNKDELKEYVTNILGLLSEKDIETIKTSPKYFLKFETVESKLNEEEFFNAIYDISFCKFLLNFYKSPWYNYDIAVYDRKKDKFDEKNKYFDYVDIVLLHLCNFLFYNEEKEQFDLEHLQLDENSNLLKFYNKHKKPFDIMDYNYRKEWCKVVQCLDDIDISAEKYNKNLGRINYARSCCFRNKIISSVFNIVTILTKICSSEKNNIKETYIKLFNRMFEANNVSDLVQEFLSLLANNSVNVTCKGEDIEVKNNVIYGKLRVTTITNNDEKLKTQLLYTFGKKCTEFAFVKKDNLFIDKLITINFQLQDEKEFYPLEYILAIFVYELQQKLTDEYYEPGFIKFPEKILLINN